MSNNVNSEFPILCENCLGDNPFLRMEKLSRGAPCKICERPFDVFRWKPGPQARMKKTEICSLCSRVKNACQTCILDLQYGIPIEVRDKVLAAAAAKSGNASAVVPFYSSNGVTSAENKNYLRQQAEESMLASGISPGASIQQMLPAAHEQLLALQRNKPYYQRNQAKLCSFFAKGECNRGDECPYRHEMPRDSKDPLSKQNIKDRFHGTNDPVAQKMLNKIGLGTDGSASTVKTSMPAAFRIPPSDLSITTAWISGITGGISEKDLESYFSRYGPIKGIRFFAPRGFAFIQFERRLDAEAAIGASPVVAINNISVNVGWANAKGVKNDKGKDGKGNAPRLLGEGTVVPVDKKIEALAEESVNVINPPSNTLDHVESVESEGVADWATSLDLSTPLSTELRSSDSSEKKRRRESTGNGSEDEVELPERNKRPNTDGNTE